MRNKAKITISIISILLLILTSFDVYATNQLFCKEKEWKWNINGYWDTDIPGCWDIVVPCDYPTIQEAVRNASVGDRIFVRKGIYNENIEINKDGLILRGEGENITIVDGGKRGDVLKINANYVNISGFTFKNSGYGGAGVNLYASSGNIIEDNKIMNNKGNGLKIYRSHGNIIKNNIVRDNNKNGVIVTFSSLGNHIKNNEISSNIKCGVLVNQISRDNLVFGNHIVGNRFGIRCIESADNNLFYSNNFVKNHINAYDNSKNEWDHNNNGNYWDDYTGPDNNDDCVGDTPYNVSGGSNQDRFPLMYSVTSSVQETKLTIQGTYIDEDFILNATNKTIVVDDEGDGDYVKIQYAIDNADSGDIIEVYSGIYNENIEMPIGVILKGIPYELGKGGDTGKPVIHGYDDNHVLTLNADGIQVYGFKIEHTGLEYAGIKIFSNFNLVEKNDILGCGDGINIYCSTNNDIVDNTITDNNFGIYTYMSHSTIVGNIVEYNDDGIVLSRSNSEIERNFLENNTYYGLLQHISTNVTVRNNTISHHDKFGVQLLGCNNNSLEGNTVTFNLQGGFSLFKSTDNIIDDNVIKGNLEGVSLWYSNNNIIDCSYFAENSYGIDLSYSDDNRITANNIFNSSATGIYIGMSKNNKLRYNDMVNCGVLVDSYLLSCWWNDVDTSNKANGKTIYYYINKTGLDISQDAGQVILVNCNLFMINSLSISNVSVGIELAYSKNNDIVDNFISHVRDGIILVRSSNNNIKNNNIANVGKKAIFLSWDSNYNLIIQNTVYNSNDVGIALETCDYNEITNNTVTAEKNENKIYSSADLKGSADTRDTIIELFFFKIGIALGFGSNGNTVNQNYVANMNISIAIGHILHVQEGNRVINNTLINNDEGIVLGYSRNNYICGNTIFNSSFAGIAMDWLSDDNYIVGNEISGGYGGIGLRTCNNNTILRNNISNFEYIGVYLWYSANNKVLQNNFFDNRQHASFNNGYQNEWNENFWDDWSGLRFRLFKNLPKRIRGGVNIINNKTPFIGFRFSIPWSNFDRHPSLTPYENFGYSEEN